MRGYGYDRMRRCRESFTDLTPTFYTGDGWTFDRTRLVEFMRPHHGRIACWRCTRLVKHMLWLQLGDHDNRAHPERGRTLLFGFLVRLHPPTRDGRHFLLLEHVPKGTP